jgi:U3 small nucleolar RNA-associated protein 23
VITQCSIRHLYIATPKNEALIEQAKTFERRRCNHHTLEQPLNTYDCLTSVVDPKDLNQNKYNYVVASQDDQVRAKMRSIPGVPLIYIKRSIMIMEPMAGASGDVRAREEKGKLKLGISRTSGRGSVLGKRSREDGEVGGESMENGGEAQDEPTSRKKSRGPKGPNPLSNKKPKARKASESSKPTTAESKPKRVDDTEGEAANKKRRRKHKSKSDTADTTAVAADDVSDG